MKLIWVFLTTIFYLSGYQSGCLALAEPQSHIDELEIILNKFPLKLKQEFLSYEVNAPLWSGKIQKKRWVKVPNGKKIRIDSQGSWNYPDGTVLVKNFFTDIRNLETRIAEKKLGQWRFSSFKWELDNQNAFKVESESIVDIVVENQLHKWTFPSEQRCLECHSNNRVFGLNTEQLNKSTNGLNQLDQFVNHGILEEVNTSEYLKKFIDPMEISHSIEERARTYMHVNCSTCHSRLGTAPGGMDFDIKLPIDLTNTYFVMASEGPVDGGGDFRILPGDKESSVLWRRLKTDGHKKMSPLRPIKDPSAIEFIGKYIDELY